MNPYAAKLMHVIEGLKAECNAEIMRLISEDAPKNKFSVVTGKVRGYERIEQEIENLERQNANS